MQDWAGGESGGVAPGSHPALGGPPHPACPPPAGPWMGPSGEGRALGKAPSAAETFPEPAASTEGDAGGRARHPSLCGVPRGWPH